jgi:hypothetical protein
MQEEGEVGARTGDGQENAEEEGQEEEEEDYDDDDDEGVEWDGAEGQDGLGEGAIGNASDAGSEGGGGGGRQLLRRHHRSRKHQRAAATRRRQQATAQRAQSLGLADAGRLDACHMPFRRVLKPSQLAPSGGGRSSSTDADAAQLDAWVRVTYQPDARAGGGRESVLTVFAGSVPPPLSQPPRQASSSGGLAAGGGGGEQQPAVEWTQCARLRGVALPEARPPLRFASFVSPPSSNFFPIL